MWRSAEKIRPQVSSAVWLGRPAPEPHTTIPFSVHAATSMWLTLRPVWLMSFSVVTFSAAARGKAVRPCSRITASAPFSRSASFAGSFTVSR